MPGGTGAIVYRPSGPVVAARAVPDTVTRTSGRAAPVSWAVTTPAMVPVSGEGAVASVCWARAAWSGSSAHNGTKSERQRPLGVTAVGRFTSILQGDGIPGSGCDRKRRALPVMSITQTTARQVNLR